MNTQTKSQGMATASLVLGIISVTCLGLLTGLPAIILGHTAYRRTRKDPERYGGSGLAVAGLAMGYASILTTLLIGGVLAGMLLPALAKAKGKAQSIKCINNLKQVGLAFRIYAADHQGQFPFNSPTNETAAATAPNALQQGDRANADPIQSIQRLADLLGSPKILICPADSSKQPASSVSTIGENNVSYEIQTGPGVNEGNPQEVLARCPIHDHELRCDGSVHQNRGW